jgi:mevalonate kinase
MVDGIAKIKERKPDLHAKFLEGVRSLVDNAQRAIEAGDAVGLGKLMDLNQMLLAGVMLSTEDIETMCRVAREAGALGCKLTGSGGGGSVIALGGMSKKSGDHGAAQALAEKIAAAWNHAGFKAFATRIACASPRERTSQPKEGP